MVVRRSVLAAVVASAMALNAAHSQAVAPSQSKPDMSAEDVAKLASHGFALFECAGYASFTKSEKGKVEQLFTRGHDELTRFIDTGRGIRDQQFAKEVNDKVPLIVSMNLGGPSTEFMVGHLWGVTELYVEDVLYDRETWTHQRNDPKASSPDKELLGIRASAKFREKNCDLL